MLFGNPEDKLRLRSVSIGDPAMVQKSHVMAFRDTRREEFRPNPRLDDLIAQLRLMLEPLQLMQNASFISPRYPVVVIVGCPRTGSTFLSQLLAASGDFTFPTNFLSRFAYAPLVGALIQQMLFNPDYDFRGELGDIQSPLTFDSKLGKTIGALGVNEFFHFWRKFFPNHDPAYLTDDELTEVDTARMRSELSAIESVFAKPFMSKGKMMQFNIAHFAKYVPELFFIHVKRQPKYVMQSVLLSRRVYYGTDEIWWSVKPREFEWLARLDPIRQIAGQVLFTERAIDEQLAKVDENRKLIIDYEELCAEPRAFYTQLGSKLSSHGCHLGEYELADTFNCSNVIKIPPEELRHLERAYAEFQADLPT